MGADRTRERITGGKMIAEILGKGPENALGSRELANMLDVDRRTVGAIIERERRKGKWICANCRGPRTGYYMAENYLQMCEYVRRLQSRGNNLLTTASAMMHGGETE